MEDQVITPKSKFDQMEKKLKEYSEIIEKEKIAIVLDFTINRRDYGADRQYRVFEGEYRDPSFKMYINKKTEDLPEGIKSKFSVYLEKIEDFSKSIEKQREELYQAVEKAEKTISEKRKLLQDIKDAVKSLPKWVLWIAKINVKNYE